MTDEDSLTPCVCFSTNLFRNSLQLDHIHSGLPLTKHIEGTREPLYIVSLRPQTCGLHIYSGKCHSVFFCSELTYEQSAKAVVMCMEWKVGGNNLGTKRCGRQRAEVSLGREGGRGRCRSSVIFPSHTEPEALTSIGGTGQRI